MVVVRLGRAVDGLVLGPEDEPVRYGGAEADDDGPVAAGDFFEEEAEAQREEHRHEEEEGGVVEAVEAGLGVRAHDAVGAEGGEAGEEEEEPVLGGFDGEVGASAQREHTRQCVDPVEAGDGAVEALRARSGTTPGTAGPA